MIYSNKNNIYRGIQLLPVVIIPRYIRLRDAPFYLGMDKNRFNKEVRPWLEPISVALQGIAFDRVGLDAWADDYKQRSRRPPIERSKTSWDVKKCPGLPYCQLAMLASKIG
jgi:hypothetical protein